MSPTLVFDVETVPDTAGIRRLLSLPDDVADADAAEIAFQQRRERTGNDFLPLHLHRVIAISCALRDRDSFHVWSLGEPTDSEKSLVQRFFDGIDRYAPQLVSWNGGGFDLPVLHYRALVNGVQAARYWDLGDEDRDFRWNNYISRYHTRHLDLMDLLSLYQGRASAPLNEIAVLLGFPGKLGMAGSKVWEAYQAGQLELIRRYCETDVVNTYLIYLRFQLLRGVLSPSQHAEEVDLVRQVLSRSEQLHWSEFLAAWVA
jgi:3'-5' exonuclease